MEDLYNLQLTAEMELPTLKKKLILNILNSAWIAVKVILTMVTFYGVVLCAKQLHENLPLPVKITEKLTIQQETEKLTRSLQYLKCPKENIPPIIDGILKGAQTIGVNPNLILALICTESGFKFTAVSIKGYEGLMQTPKASMEYADVDILYGCRILQEKMNNPLARTGSKVDIRKALALYKGGLSKMAFRQADETLTLYRKLNSISNITG